MKMPSQTLSPMADQKKSLSIISKCTIYPHQKSTLEPLKLSVSDLPMLSCHYIQKGCLFPLPPSHHFLSLLKTGLSRTLSLFPPLAGRLTTDPITGHVHITSNDAGADFLHAAAAHIQLRDLLSPNHVPDFLTNLFAFNGSISYDGHFRPLLAVQVTELADGVFIGCSVNHAVTDGTSFWNFFNAFADSCRGGGGGGLNFKKPSRRPDFRRESVLISPAVLRFPDGPPRVTFDLDAPLRERIFSFSRESILKLKSLVNKSIDSEKGSIDLIELMGKTSNDFGIIQTKKAEISSFQSLCALLWRAVTRARKFPAGKTTTFRMAVNVRHRLEPELDHLYFGNAIQSVPTYGAAGEVTCRGIRWCAEQLNRSVAAHDDGMVRKAVGDWEREPRCFPLGNFDGGMITMGSSPRFPMYDNDFGWGRPVAVRSGRANKFDGKISAFPGREGGGSVDLEVVLAPETMAGLESDSEFMQYVSVKF